MRPDEAWIRVVAWPCDDHAYGKIERMPTAEPRPSWLSMTVLTISDTHLRGFNEALGFAVVGRSPLDDTGRPYPILHTRRETPRREGAA